MHDFSNLLSKDAIFLDLQIKGPQSLLRQLSETLADLTRLDPRDILHAVTDRERLGSTAIGYGVAIPHARLNGIDKSIGAFARLRRPLDFDAFDKEPCDLIFMLLAPLSEGSDHLRALAQISRAFSREEFRDHLRAANTYADITNLLLKKGQGQAA